MTVADTPVPSTSSGTSRRSTSAAAEQLEERRRLHAKRKAEQDLAANGQTLYGSWSASTSSEEEQSARKKGKANSPALINENHVFGEDDTNGFSNADADAVLRSFGVDESLIMAARDDIALRNDLLAQYGATGPAGSMHEAQPALHAADDMFRLDDQMGELPDELAQLIIYGPPRPPLPYTFRNGALRITRTPGRMQPDSPLCISMDQLIDKDRLVSCCVFAFMIGDGEFYRYLPLKGSANVPLYIGRDINLDPYATQILSAHGETRGKARFSRKQLDKIRPDIRNVSRQQYGENFHIFHPQCQGCAHSKILVLIYPDFCRLVITSCNLINIDMMQGDNHWYIHDLSRYANGVPLLPPKTEFEAQFTFHLKELGVPSSFFDNHFSGRFDFQHVQVELVTSRPGTTRGVPTSGLLRLREVVYDWRTHDVDMKRQIKKVAPKIEYCSGSIGHLNDKWLKEFYDCAIGRDSVPLAKLDCDVPPFSVVFPTFDDVDQCDELARTTASRNIGCHMNWGNAPEKIQDLFHHYKSKDTGKLFHMKFMMVLDGADEQKVPYYIYVGSANFSKGAWGTLAKDPKGNPDNETRGLQVQDCANYECGVLIPRSVLPTLIPPGAKWQDIIPYQWPAQAYKDSEGDMSTKRPFLKNPHDP